MFDINKDKINYDYPNPNIETAYNPAPTYTAFNWAIIVQSIKHLKTSRINTKITLLALRNT
jgi:hypothetical protein